MEEQNFVKTRFGKFGAFLPMLTFVGGVVGMSLCGLRSTENLWLAGFLSLVVGWAVCKDAKRFQAAVSNGVRSPALAALIPILILSCVLGKLIGASQLGDALLYWCLRINLPAGLIPVVIFLMSTIVSFATGSSSAAFMCMYLVVLPVAYSMGCNMGLAVGALLSGGQVGDNLAPISDSTVVSAMTQEVDVSKAYKFRIKYSAICFVVSLVLYCVFGFTSVAGGTISASGDPAAAKYIVYLIVPVIIMTIMLKTNNFFNAVLIGGIVATVMLLLFGQVTVMDLISAKGLIAGGISTSTSGLMFLIFIFIMLEICKETGCTTYLQEFIVKLSGNSVKAREAACGLFACCSVAIIASGTSAISFSGPIIRDIMRPTRISRARTASIVGGLCASLGCLLPWTMWVAQSPAMLLAAGCVPENFTGLDFVPFMFYNILLFLVYWAMILVGFDRKIETKEEILADGATL